MEYPNQRDVAGRERDVSPAERTPHVHREGMITRQEIMQEMEGGCGCEQTPTVPEICPIPQAPTCCVPTCHPCGENSWGLDSYPLAMVYAPCQAFGNLYDLDTALKQGTLFSELDLPIQTANGTGGKGGCGCGGVRRKS